MVDVEYLQSHLGPIDFVAVEIPADADVGSGFRRLLDLVDQHIIRILDLEFIARGEDGSLAEVTAASIGQRGGFDFSVFDGASSGLLDSGDFEEVAATLQPGSIAAILVYEELALLPVLADLEANGSRLIGEGSVDIDELAAALDDK